VVDDAEIRIVNRDYLQRDKPTNVISFAMREGEGKGRSRSQKACLEWWVNTRPITAGPLRSSRLLSVLSRLDVVDYASSLRLDRTHDYSQWLRRIGQVFTQANR